MNDVEEIIKNPSRAREWRCSNRKLDILETFDFVKHVENIAEAAKSIGTHDPFGIHGSRGALTMDLSEVTFCTLLGVSSLASAVSRCISDGITLVIDPPAGQQARKFMRYFGFDNLLRRARDVRAIYITDSLGGSEMSYGERVFHSRAIFSNNDVEHFLEPRIIGEWIKGLSADIRECAFFQHGSFSRIVGAEMSRNILEHSRLPQAREEGRESFGVVAMRVVKLDENAETSWLRQAYGDDLFDFATDNAHRGFVEVCICDPGVGIGATLEDSFNKRYKKITGGAPAPCSKDDRHLRMVEILQFAFDELGTSKSEDEHWLTEAHALSRILHLVNVHSGVLRVIANTAKLTYRYDDESPTLAERGLGYQARSEPVYCSWGSYFQILIPLTQSSHVRDSIDAPAVRLQAAARMFRMVSLLLFQYRLHSI